MVINFILPVYSKYAVGGYKVVFEYANKMALHGNQVNIIYPLKIDFKKLQKINLYKKIEIGIKASQKNKSKQNTARIWFPLQKNILEITIPYPHQKYIPNADFTFATAWSTACWVNEYDATKGKKFYLIQHYEIWDGTKEQVDSTLIMPLQKIVISRWLKDVVMKLNQNATIVNNGLDVESFFVKKDIETRNPTTVIMLYHNITWKASSVGLKSLAIVQEKIRDLKVILFSTQPNPGDLPNWITFHQNPTNLIDLYNSAAIFISPSIAEGWALPPAEAMQCGCAAVLTDIGGHQDYGEEGKDLCLVEVNNANAMAQKITELINDNTKRIGIAKAGNENIKQFTWEKAYYKLNEIMLHAIDKKNNDNLL